LTHNKIYKLCLKVKFFSKNKSIAIFLTLKKIDFKFLHLRSLGFLCHFFWPTLSNNAPNRRAIKKIDSLLHLSEILSDFCLFTRRPRQTHKPGERLLKKDLILHLGEWRNSIPKELQKAANCCVLCRVLGASELRSVARGLIINWASREMILLAPNYRPRALIYISVRLSFAVE